MCCFAGIQMELLTQLDLSFFVKLVFSLVAGFVIGAERESRNKVAGISTQSFVIGGAMLFSFISQQLEPGQPGRIAAGIVIGIGFLGAGIIMRNEGTGKIINVTTAASIWFAAAIGMAIGFGWYVIAAASVVYAGIVPRIPHIRAKKG